ncbi:MAG: hypothetical protein LQ342_006576 [Letrouitia transgressa]|nr:MAG: hypothetical protein LQ342_006576 [Letrouitia transgressa]
MLAWFKQLIQPFQPKVGFLSERRLDEKATGEKEETSVIYREGASGKIPDSARQLLEQYSKIPPDDVEAHVYKIKDRGFSIRPYPCIGHLRFLALSLSLHPRYPDVLQRVKEGQSFLELGTCFGQELRKLVFDGAPSNNLYGVELVSDFVDLGYELFLDKKALQVTFLQADIMQQPQLGRPELEGQLDVIYASSFFHLFTREEQYELAKTVVSLLRPKKGSLLLGRQMGTVKPGNYPLRKLEERELWRHDVDSFKQMWDEVGRATGTAWLVEASLDEEELGYKGNESWADPDMRRILFAVHRL